MESWRSGSIHSEVPVYPRCPNERGGKIFSRLRWRGRRVPAQCPGSASRRGFAASEERQRFRTNQRRSSLQKNVSESRQIFRGGEQAGVSGDSAQHAGVFILHFALDDSFAKGAVIGGGRNRSAPRGRRIVGSVRHPQRAEYFPLAETVKAFVGDTLQRDRQNDEADVAVLSSCAGISRQRSGECRRQQFIPGLAP